MAEMTPRERLLAAIRFEGPDRIPLSPGLHQLVSKRVQRYGGNRFEQYLKLAEEYGIDPIIEIGIPPNCFNSTVGFDYSVLKDVKVEIKEDVKSNAIYYRRKFETPAGILTDVIMKPTGPEYGYNPMLCIKEGMVKGEEDLDKIPFLFFPPELLDPKGEIRKRQKEIGDRGLGAYMIRGALDCRAGYCREIADMMVDYYDNYDFFKKHIMIHHQHSLSLIKAALEAGAEVIKGSWYFTGISAGWSPKIIKEEFIPLIKEQAELVKSYNAIYMIYDDGKVMGILDMLKDTGIDLLETCAPPPAGDFELQKAREIVGKSYAFKGGMDQTDVIYRRTPEFIEEKVKEIMLAADPSGGFILSTGDPILQETPERNVKALIDAGKKYGRLK